MIVAHRNKIVEMFLNDAISNKEDATLVKVKGQASEIAKVIKGNSMYYDLIYLEISSTYDTKQIKELIKLETSEVRLILMYDSLDEYRKAKSFLESKQVDVQAVSFSTIKKERVMIYLTEIFRKIYSKKFKNKLIERIYQYLLYKSKINAEIAKIASFRTIKDVETYTSRKFRIRPSNFAENVLYRKNKKEVCEFILENESNLNYLIVILSNYVSGILDTYEIVRENKLTLGTVSEVYLDNKDISKRMSFKEFKNNVIGCLTFDYAYLFLLNEKIGQAKTKIQKQLLLLELIK